MILAALLTALALQSSPPPLLRDPAFLAAHEAWAACTNRAADAEVASARSAEEIAAAALAACPDEQAATRRAVLAFSGERRGAEDMVVILDGNREGLADRVRELRRRAAAAPQGGSPPAAAANPFDAAISVWVNCLVRQIDAAAADAPEARALDAAFGACAAEQEALHRQGVARGGAGRADEFIRRARALNREHLLTRLHARRRR
jgi:hypothetical protein